MSALESVASSSASAVETNVDSGDEGLVSILQRPSISTNKQVVKEVPPLLGKAYPEIKIEEFLGEGAYSEAYSFTYLEEGQIKRRVIKLSKERKALEFGDNYKLEKEWVGGEWLAFLDYRSKNVLQTHQAIAYDNVLKRYILVDAATVQALFEDENKRAEIRYTLIGTVSEYIEGAQTLDKYMLSDDARDEKTVDAIAEQILQAVKAVHDRRIIHRDIKPGNILIGKDKTLKLFDFGFSLHPPFCPEKRYFDVISPYFAAPEIYTTGYYTSEADSYAIASTLLQVATGKEDYFGVKGDAEALKYVVIRGSRTLGEFAQRAGVNKKLYTIIWQLSFRDCQRRDTAAGVLRDNYREVVMGKKTSPSEAPELTVLTITDPPESFDGDSVVGEATWMNSALKCFFNVFKRD